MYGNIDFDIEKVETIVYEPWDVPDPEDYDINDYNSEAEMREDMLECYSFLVDFYDIFGEKLNWKNIELSYSDVVEELGEEIAKDMINSEGISRGGKSFELRIGVNTTPKSMSLEDVDEVAKRILPTTVYYPGCRGFILYDGTIVQTEAEHNMCSVIEGVKGTFHFIELGNIRILNQSVDLAKEPTPQQRRVLAQVINSYSEGDFYLDIMTGDAIGVHYYQPNYRRVLADIDRYFSEGIKPNPEQLFEQMVTEKKEETTFYRFYSEIRGFLTKLLKNPIKAKPTKYLEDRGLTQKRLIKMLRDNDIIKRDEKILVPGKDDVKHVTYSVKYTLKSDKFEDKIETIYHKYFPDEELKENTIKQHLFNAILNEEMNMYSCPNIIGVVAGKGKGVGSEMCDRWAKYVNNNKDKPRSLFADEDKMKTNKSLWEEFSKYLDIVSEIMVNRTSLTLLEESNNFSAVPNGWNMWVTVYNYCKKYIQEHEPEHYENYGTLYKIKLPEYIITNSFWEKLDCTIYLGDIRTLTKQAKLQIEGLCQYNTNLSDEEIDYVRKHGKFKTVKIKLSSVNEPKNFLNDELYLNFAHEILHAYENFCRIKKGVDNIEQYKQKSNYYDFISGRKMPNESGWKEENLLRNLFHFFNKTELRAIVAEFSTEIQNHPESWSMVNGALDGTHEVITSTKTWKKICDAENIINLLNTIQDTKIKKNLLDAYNKHIVHGKANTYESMLKHVNRYFWNIKQIMFKKFSKILFDIYGYNNTHSSR